MSEFILDVLPLRMSQIEVYRVFPKFVDEPAGVAELEGDEARHLLQVRRAVAGERVMLIDGAGSAWPAELIETNGKSARFSIGERLDRWREPGVAIHLGLAVLKGDHWLDALDGCVQAGVQQVTPLKTDRSIAGWKENKARRAERRSLEAAKQCGRGLVPPIDSLHRLAEWCIKLPDDVERFVCEAGGNAVPILPNGAETAVAVGPEGGFTADEIVLLEDHGFKRIDLGARRFRAEMAAIVAVSRLIGPTESPLP